MQNNFSFVPLIKQQISVLGQQTVTITLRKQINEMDVLTAKIIKSTKPAIPNILGEICLAGNFRLELV